MKNLHFYTPLAFICCFLLLSCSKDPKCGEDIVIERINLSRQVKEGLKLQGSERIVYRSNTGAQMIFKSDTLRKYSIIPHRFFLICEAKDYRDNQFEVVEMEQYTIRYVDSLNALNKMVVNAEIRKSAWGPDNELYEQLSIELYASNSRVAAALYFHNLRYNWLTRTSTSFDADYNPQKPFYSNLADTILNNVSYQNLVLEGTQMYNELGVLGFRLDNGEQWTIESF